MNFESLHLCHVFKGFTLINDIIVKIFTSTNIINDLQVLGKVYIKIEKVTKIIKIIDKIMGSKDYIL